MKKQCIKFAIASILALSSASVWAHGNAYASICPTLVQQYEDSIPLTHKNTAKLVRTEDIEVRTLFLSKDSLQTITFKCPKDSEFMNSRTCRFKETGLFATKDLVRPIPITDSDFGNVGTVLKKQHLYECKFVIGYTLD